jgi:hypothetical protein
MYHFSLNSKAGSSTVLMSREELNRNVLRITVLVTGSTPKYNEFYSGTGNLYSVVVLLEFQVLVGCYRIIVVVIKCRLNCTILY